MGYHLRLSRFAKVPVLLALLTVLPAVFSGNSDPQYHSLNATWYESDALVGPHNSLGCEYCFVDPLTGTPNGILTDSFSDSLTHVFLFGTGDLVNT